MDKHSQKRISIYPVLRQKMNSHHQKIVLVSLHLITWKGNKQQVAIFLAFLGADDITEFKPVARFHFSQRERVLYWWFCYLIICWALRIQKFHFYHNFILSGKMSRAKEGIITNRDFFHSKSISSTSVIITLTSKTTFLSLAIRNI